MYRKQISKRSRMRSAHLATVRGGLHRVSAGWVPPPWTYPPLDIATPSGRELGPEISTAPLERAWDQEYSPISLVDGMTDRRL